MMSDDIVTRLRNFTCEELNCKSDEIAEEAADEIESLRLDVKDLQKIIQLLKEADDD